MNPPGLSTPPRLKLKIRQMQLLLAVDDCRNIARGAEACHMTQPAASRMLKEIEQQFGVDFFERGPRGVVPTFYGRTMIQHVRMAFGNLALGQSAIADLMSGMAGTVTVGTIVTPTFTLLPRAIARTKETAPRLTIGVTVGTSDGLVPQLQRGEFDFLIARVSQNANDSSLVYEDIAEESECAVVRAQHPLVERTDLALDDIASTGWVLSPKGTLLRHRFDMMFRRRGIEPPCNVVETTAEPVIMALLQQTEMLHVMPTEVARYHASTGELKILQIDLPCRMDSYGLIRRRDQLLSPGANLLLDHLRTVARDTKTGMPDA